ncbi:hypothetical protein [Frankia sp. Cj3]|uniref:hypothetical protein n=1 Tax=Frankia sp. Cj3 TaxID=2880976 RepID=UPI001EF557DD|nr:hypothetical protein [Frankia sp. Cj3]
MTVHPPDSRRRIEAIAQLATLVDEISDEHGEAALTTLLHGLINPELDTITAVSHLITLATAIAGAEALTGEIDDEESHDHQHDPDLDQARLAAATTARHAAWTLISHPHTQPCRTCLADLAIPAETVPAGLATSGLCTTHHVRMAAAQARVRHPEWMTADVVSTDIAVGAALTGVTV